MDGCQYCCNPELFHVFELIDEETVPGAERLRVYDEYVEKCTTCSRYLEDNDYIIEDENLFLDESLKFLANMINDEIHECQSCNWTIIPYEQRYGNSLDLSTVGQLVEGYSIPSNLQGRIYENLHCKCGEPVSHDDPYVTEGELRSWFNDETEFIEETFNTLEEETFEFIEFLQENPMLGLTHPVGQQIFNKIKNNDFLGIEKIEVGTTFYRGRKRNQHQRLVPFIEDELWNPPIGVPNQGRYNPHGVTNLYLGDNIDAIMLEIKPSILDIVDIAEFEILTDLKVFDSTKTDIDIFAGKAKGPDEFSSSIEYVFPNFLSQCLSYHGFNGIVYTSVKDSDALNLCLFNFTKDQDIKQTKIHTNFTTKVDDISLRDSLIDDDPTAIF